MILIDDERRERERKRDVTIPAFKLLVYSSI